MQLQRLGLAVEVTANHHDGLRLINLDFGHEILDLLDPPDPPIGVRQVDVHQVDLEVVADDLHQNNFLFLEGRGQYLRLVSVGELPVDPDRHSSSSPVGTAYLGQIPDFLHKVEGRGVLDHRPGLLETQDVRAALAHLQVGPSLEG